MDFAFGLVNFVDGTQKVGKGAFDNFDGLAGAESGFVFGGFLLHEFFDGFHFGGG